MTAHEQTIRAFWDATELRDWARLSALLSPDLVYEMEQTRERVAGRDAFLRFFGEFPGDWHLVVRRVVADEQAAVSVVDFTIDGEPMTGISLFDLDQDGLVTRIEDVWPEAYERPESRAHLTDLY